MKFRKPQLVPLLFIIITTIMLCGLGAWQLERLNWKLGQLGRINVMQNQPIMGDLPQEMTGADYEKLTYRKVAFTGTFLYEKQMHLIGRQMGQDVGYFMLTPFVLDDDGRIILVNRGFSPSGKEKKPEGVQTVHGIIRPMREHRMFAPENHPEKNVWFYEDMSAMEKATGLTLTPIFVEATGESKPGEFPIPSDGKIAMRNDHLAYAITWFSLALVGLVMFGLYHRIPEKK